MTELVVKQVDIESLTPDPENVRQHDARNLSAIAQSLHHFGQRKPVVVRKSGSELVVIAGNGTLEAAKALGWSKIAVAEVPADWNDAKARAYAIADNRTAELADWNKVELASALVELADVGWEAETLGFGANPSAIELSDDEPLRFDKEVTCPNCQHVFTPKKKSSGDFDA